MTDPKINNPLHGITLVMMLENLVDHYGWKELGQRIPVRCFNHDPSVKSSLKFLRRTPWARERVEGLYLATQRWERKRQRREQSNPEQNTDTQTDTDDGQKPAPPPA